MHEILEICFQKVQWNQLNQAEVMLGMHSEAKFTTGCKFIPKFSSITFGNKIIQYGTWFFQNLIGKAFAQYCSRTTI